MEDSVSHFVTELGFATELQINIYECTTASFDIRDVGARVAVNY